MSVPMHVAEGRAGRWYLWYAWRPVRLDDPVGKTVWLRWILRRTFFAAPWFRISSWQEYRAVKA